MKENLASSVQEENVEDLPSSTLTKAGRLQRELSNEKKRLAKELEELQAEYDEVKPTTPTGTAAAMNLIECLPNLSWLIITFKNVSCDFSNFSVFLN